MGPYSIRIQNTNVHIPLGIQQSRQQLAWFFAMARIDQHKQSATFLFVRQQVSTVCLLLQHIMSVCICFTYVAIDAIML